ncbi:hypothetical protein [Paraburkholderia caffeinitolerans]|uniref:hypothetical protein n=1 Tax=Paraburkholderia caffeinitolerans TaxID=1723730 RepID=UPI001581D80C|nr:hypothetical protein [Paraburkholderia caffeinitolerans]
MSYFDRFAARGANVFEKKTGMSGRKNSIASVVVGRHGFGRLLVGERDAERLALQTKTLSESLAQTEGWSPPHLKARALLQTHCYCPRIRGFVFGACLEKQCHFPIY